MECPHCGYAHRWSNKSECDVKGDCGDFYTLPIKMERESFYSDEKNSVKGCPKCGVVFMAGDW